MTTFTNGYHQRKSMNRQQEHRERERPEHRYIDTPAHDAMTPEEEEIVAHSSPEGRPEHAGPRLKGTLSLVLLGGALIGALAVLVGFTSGWGAGVVVLVFGLGIGLLTNPEIGAALMRGQERERVHHDDEHDIIVRVKNNDAKLTHSSASRHDEDA